MEKREKPPGCSGVTPGGAARGEMAAWEGVLLVSSAARPREDTQRHWAVWVGR